jgi:hypothetical protein
MKSRFRFSLRNIVWTTFWASVCGASFSVLRGLDIPNPWGWWWHLNGCFFMVLLYLFIASPFISIAALCGRPIVGMIVGLIATILIWYLLLIAVYD